MTDRTRRRRKEARPDEIVAAAIREFAEKGYAGASMGGIAARAQIARSTVYLYFEDKQALIRYAFEDRIAAAIDAAFGATMAPDLPFEAAFRAMLGLVYDRIVGSDAIVLLRVLIAEGARFPELSRFYHDAILSRATCALNGMIAEGIRRGEVRAELARFDARLVIAPVLMAAVWRLTFEEIAPMDLPTLIEGHVEMAMSGLLVRTA